jgi:hypothetical protein
MISISIRDFVKTYRLYQQSDFGLIHKRSPNVFYHRIVFWIHRLKPHDLTTVFKLHHRMQVCYPNDVFSLR